jgi:hypothetical protein
MSKNWLSATRIWIGFVILFFAIAAILLYGKRKKVA